MAEQGQRDRIEDRQPLAAKAVGAKLEPRAADVGERIEASGTHRRGLWRARDLGKNKEGQLLRFCGCRLDIFHRYCYTAAIHQHSGAGVSMRQPVSENMVAFRASEVLVVALSERARASGVTVSEYLRGMVRERVGLN